MNNLIYKKMSSVMAEVKGVEKTQKNTAQGFKFRGIDDMINAFYPALVRHGVFMVPRATSYNQELKEVTRSSGKVGVDKHVSILMEYDFFAEDGSKVTIGPIPAEGLDSGDKATNKALSAALKYALIQTFSVPTEDMAEADLESPEIGRTQQNTVKVVSNVDATMSNVTNPNAEFDAIAAPLTTSVKSSSFRKNSKVATATTVTPSTELTVEEWA